ncbi:MAG: rRNA maturation RNase YbeY [Bacillota bacterium]
MEVVCLNNQGKINIDEQTRALLEKVALHASTRGAIAGELTISLVDDEQIAELHQRYKGISGPTDVLAFTTRETGGDEPPVRHDIPDLHDVVISVETASRQAEEYGHSLAIELAILVAHGVLHIIGYDDADEYDRERMNREQDAILREAGL